VLHDTVGHRVEQGAGAFGRGFVAVTGPTWSWRAIGNPDEVGGLLVKVGVEKLKMVTPGLEGG
jgi:hypothetical protein